MRHDEERWASPHFPRQGSAGEAARAHEAAGGAREGDSACPRHVA